jgi:uncharacterized protein (TIGR00299 family) protein
MNLAALVELGVPKDLLVTELGKLGLQGYSLHFTPDSRKGIQGTRVDVELAHENDHDQIRTHGHERGDARERSGEHVHGHRFYSDIVSLVEASALSPAVKKRALAILAVIGKAESKVHNRPLDEVHFHEVGAVDSIVDIVGAAICLEYLNPDRVLSSTVELGGGFVETQHGLLPVPAPATAEILTGVPVRSGIVPFETTTPTGAAILSACVDRFTDDKRFTIVRTGYGVGHRDTEIPNLLRVFLGEETPSPSAQETSQPAWTAVTDRVLECNLDDMSPEVTGYLFDKLLACGASDVYCTPILMKKNRPAVKLSVLCPTEAEGRIADVLLRETTTFGLRRFVVEKTALKREERTVATSLGEVRMKCAFLDGRPVKSKPEFEDCRRIAEERKMPLREVYETILREAK